jgi:predicted metal-dependent hydrolase
VEELWRAAGEEEDRAFLEALVQVAAALHLRLRRGAHRGALNLLEQAVVRLDDHRPARMGVDVEALCRESEAYIESLRRAAGRKRPAWLERFRVPQIRTVRPAGTAFRSY